MSRSVAHKLHLSRRTIRSTITKTSRQTIRVKLSKAMLASMKKRRVRSAVVSARFTATYSDKRSKTAAKRVSVKR